MTTNAGRKPRHRVAVVAFDGVVLGDLSIPVEVFGQRHGPARTHYDVVVCSPTPQVATDHIALAPPRRLATLMHADTVVVPGHIDVQQPVPPSVLGALRRAQARGARIASICTGAFTLAAAGLLDGRRATTHWATAELLADLHPQIDVEPDVLYVDEGRILTSAGAAAGFDLCLHMMRVDYGAAFAAEVARLAVMPLERSGGQAQYVSYASELPQLMPLAPLLVWIDEHLSQDLSVEVLARRARMSPRSLNRHFTSQMGISPAQWVATARVRRAQALLERTSMSMEEVATAVGFGSAVTLRQRFAAVVGTSPRDWRRSFNSANNQAG